MDRANLLAVPEGAMLRARADPSKCDRDDMEWGDRDMWFRLNRGNPLNFAAAWIDWELAHPCPVARRGAWAAFSPDGAQRPFATRLRDFYA